VKQKLIQSEVDWVKANSGIIIGDWGHYKSDKNEVFLVRHLICPDSPISLDKSNSCLNCGKQISKGILISFNIREKL